jgi:3-hydroxyisobutyrate dehydrogenase-like beta-hydroxyacid dehydrogenase
MERRGMTVLDAPLTGSRAQAEAGTLNVICGGPREAFDRVRRLFEAFAHNVFHVGASGCGHAIKLINNFLGQLSLAAVAEMLPLARRCGVDLKYLQDVVSVSGGDSKAFQGLMPRAIQRDFGVAFQQKFVHKDVRYLNDLARGNGVPALLAGALLTVHDMAAAQGYGEEDASALVKFWERMSGAAPDE